MRQPTTADALREHMARDRELVAAGMLGTYREEAHHVLHQQLRQHGFESAVSVNEFILHNGLNAHVYRVSGFSTSERFLATTEVVGGRSSSEIVYLLPLGAGEEPPQHLTSVHSAVEQIMQSGSMVLELNFYDPVQQVAVYRFLGFAHDLAARDLNAGKLGPVALFIGHHELVRLLRNPQQATLNTPPDDSPVTTVTRYYGSAQQKPGPPVFAIFPRPGLTFRPTLRAFPDSGFEGVAEFHTNDPIRYDDALMLKNQDEFQRLVTAKTASRKQALKVLGRSEAQQYAWETQVLVEAAKALNDPLGQLVWGALDEGSGVTVQVQLGEPVTLHTTYVGPMPDPQHPEQIEVELWSNLTNPWGQWEPVRATHGGGRVWQVSVTPKKCGRFEYTFRYRESGVEWCWADLPRGNGAVEVFPAKPQCTVPRTIVHVAYEGPGKKAGGLGDVMRELLPALAKKGYDISLIMPRHADITLGDLINTELTVTVQTKQHGEVKWRLFSKRYHGVIVYYLDHQDFFRKGYAASAEEGTYEAAVFSRAAVECLRVLGIQPDIVNSHDWQTGLVSTFLKTQWGKEFFPHTASVFTIHNLGYKGDVPHGFVTAMTAELKALGLADEAFTAKGLEFWRHLSLIKGGLVHADQLTTVSPLYRNETLTKEGGYGLEGVLWDRERNYVGILNGLDLELWNPWTTSPLAARYAADRLEDIAAGKAANKERLQEEFSEGADAKARREDELIGHLPVDPDAPMVAIVSRLVAQKGMNLLTPEIVESMVTPQIEGGLGLQLVIQGTGELQEHFRTLATRFEGRVVYRKTFDEWRARQIFAGTDFLLLPSKYEPAGLAQLQGMRYGALPIVRRVGGLEDTVIDGELEGKPGEGTGFKFTEFTSEAVYDAVERASTMWRERPDEILRMRQRAMRSVPDWSEVVPKYERLYQRVLHQRLGISEAAPHPVKETVVG